METVWTIKIYLSCAGTHTQAKRAQPLHVITMNHKRQSC